jgi:transposase
MPREKRRDLQLHMRSRILELQSIGYSYNKIATLYQLPISIVKSIVYKARNRKEGVFSKARCGAPRVFIEDQRDELIKAVTLTLEITHAALQAQIALNASIRSMKRLFQDMNI